MDNQHEPATPPRPPAAEKQPREKILIVDDDLSNRWMLAELLRGQGYEPIEAADATTAYEIFLAAQPAAVLLDINLPDGSGLDVLRQIKQAQPQTIVIMTTGELVIENTISALRGGADDFIGKPLHVEELNFALSRSLGARVPPKPIGQHQPQVLLISDGVEQLPTLQSAFAPLAVNITTLYLTPEALDATPLASPFDLLVVDVGPELLEPLLKQIRDLPELADIPVLVAANRVTEAEKLAGVMPKYRAMPCTPQEMLRLAERRLLRLMRPSVIPPDPL